MRTFLAVVLVVAAAFLTTILAPREALAVTANWQGPDLVIDGKTYKSVPDIASGDSRGEPAGTRVYQYLNTSTSPVTAENILFGPQTEPSNSVSAILAIYDYTPPSDYRLKGEKQTITVNSGSSPNASEAGDSGNAGVTCAVEGVGWIVCNLARGMATGMDWIFGVIGNFMTVAPITGDRSTAIYRAWEYMRNIANILLVIVFLVMIYSNITSMGITNYGIKKSLPRLVLGAILVNISFWLCAAAVDLSNILGSSISSMFLNIGNSVTGGAEVSSMMTWKSLADLVLAGGAAVTVGGLAYAGVISFAGAWTFLLPVLVGVGLAVIAAVIVLAARQALIMVLIMVAPLAIIAYILPNTNKYFDKWKDIFTTMLVLFPAFAVVFGAAQLAGRVMIYSADSAAGLIFGFAVMAAPLYITPLLIKFSGTLLGRIANIVNNPDKGLIDRTRNWGAQHREQQRGKELARGKGLIANRRRARFQRNRRREEDLETHKKEAENAYRRSVSGREATRMSRDVAHHRQLIDAEDEQRWNEALNSTKSLRERELKLRVTTDQSNLQKAIMDATHTELKAGHYSATYGPHNREVTDLISTAFDTNEQASLSGMRKQMAEVHNRKELAKRLLANKDSRTYAGGIMGHDGAESVAASAMNVELEALSKGINDKVSMMDYFDVNSADRQKLALGAENVEIKDQKTGEILYTFEKDENFTRRAALKLQMKSGSVGQIREIMDSVSVVAPDGKIISEGVNYEYRSTISSEMVNAGLGSKLQQWSAKSIDDMLNGIYSEKIANATILSGGKIKDETFVTLAAESIDSLLSMVGKASPGKPVSPEIAALSPTARADAIDNLQDLRYAAYRIRRDPLLNKGLTKAAKRAMDRWAEKPSGVVYTEPIKG